MSQNILPCNPPAPNTVVALLLLTVVGAFNVIKPEVTFGPLEPVILTLLLILVLLQLIVTLAFSVVNLLTTTFEDIAPNKFL